MPEPTPAPKAERLNLAAFVKHILEINENVHTERFCWVVGAGCSVTSGIPSGKTLAAEWLQKLHEDYKNDGESLEAFCTRLTKLAPADKWDFSKLDPQNPGAHYSELYDFCFMRSVKQGFSRLERAMRGKDPSLGYTILARFLAETRHRVVLTTNFDNLISDAVAIHTSVFPFVCGHESLVRFLKLEDARPLVLKIHRDLLLDPLNRKAELDRLHQSWRTVLDEILAECTPIVIGYDGYDGTLMRYLKERASLNGHLYWCHLASEEPRPEIHELVLKHRGLLVAIDGFDELMLRIGRPLNYTDPLTTMSQRFEQRKKTYTEQLDVLQKRIDAKPGPGLPTPPPDDDLKQALAQAVKQAEVAVDWWAWEKKARAQKDPAKRDSIYQFGIEACPLSPELHCNYAVFLHTIRKEHDRAEALYRKALELDPNSGTITGNYAAFLKDVRKDYDRAEVLYLKTLELAPNSARNTGNYAAFLYTIRKEYDRAEALYRKALEIDSNHPINTSNYANFLTDIRKDHDRAEALYRKALEIEPNRANTNGNYASFLRQIRKDYGQAEAFYRKALEIDPSDAFHTGNYASFLMEIRKDADRAEGLYRRALELDPNSAANTGNYALFLRSVRKDDDRAEVLYRKALELDPNNAVNTGNYAVFLKDVRKDHARAEALYRKAIELDPNDAVGPSNYAEYLLEQRKWAAGEDQLRRAWKLGQSTGSELLAVAALMRVISLWGQAGSGEVPDMATLRQSLGSLKHLFTEEVRVPSWSFDSLLAALSPGWPEERVRFAQALADVVTDKVPLVTLDAFPEWRDTPPVAPTLEW